MKRLCYLVVLLVALGQRTHAAEPTGLELFPAWERKLCGCPTGGIEHACYTFEQAKVILKTDFDLQLKLEELEVLKANLADAKSAVEKLTQANALLINATTALDTRLTEKHKLLEKTSLALQQAQQRDILGGGLPWIVGIAAAVGIVGFVGGVLLMR